MFIVAEGMDGAGKTTQIRLLAERLRTAGHDVVLTREPGGTALAERIRALVVEGDPDSMDAHTELLLYTAARRHHVLHTIQPALSRGAIVLCDRFIDSTHALQGAAGVSASTIDTLHHSYVGIDPDLVLFFDLDPDVALTRAVARGGATQAEDRMERKGAAFHARVGAILRERACLPGRLRIDANGSINTVAGRVDAQLMPLLPSPSSTQRS